MPEKSSSEIFPLCDTGKGFKIGNAIACALASKATYLAPELIPKIVIDEWGFTDYRRINGNHIQGFVATSKRITLVAFRGSEAHVSNWQDNLDAGFVPGPFNEGDRLHRGFAQGTLQLLHEIQTRIKALGDPDAPLFLTGHSLGAALATLTAASFYNESRPVHSVYGFGSPRVGCRHFRKSYQSRDAGRTFRVVNQHDLIARTPPRFLRYRHVGLLRYLDDNAAIHADPNTWQRLLLYVNPKGRNPREYINAILERFPGAIDDHRIENYLEKLQSLSDRNDKPL
ncbi:MAG: lipase family protein [Verrucomicrobiaceae bacterium]|nr:lipase family protein [Verrucomicrobiaceae bacterium]